MWKFIRSLFKRKQTIGSKGIAQEQNQLTSEDRIAPRDTNSRFRVLILGPTYAGKTTLLERLTESPAGAAIVTRNGRSVILVPTIQRSCSNLRVYLSDRRGPQGIRSSKSPHSKFVVWLLDVFITSSGVSTVSTTKSLMNQTLASFSTSGAVSKREGSRKSRMSGNLFKRARQLSLQSNCTQFGACAHVDAHVLALQLTAIRTGSVFPRTMAGPLIS